jgi:hypothetical protein
MFARREKSQKYILCNNDVKFIVRDTKLIEGKAWAPEYTRGVVITVLIRSIV